MSSGDAWRDRRHGGRRRLLRSVHTTTQFVLPLCQSVTWGVRGVTRAAVLTHAAAVAVADPRRYTSHSG